MGDLARNGITEKTPKSIPFGAGVVYKNFTYSNAEKKWSGDILCATKDGSVYSLTPTHLQIEVDGMLVALEGTDVVTDFIAKIDINVAEYKKSVLIDAIHGQKGTSEDENYEVYRPDPALTNESYVHDLAFVGQTTSGEHVIVVFDSAICTSGIENDNKPKAQGGYKVTYEARGTLADLEKIPVRIYYPTELG